MKDAAVKDKTSPAFGQTWLTRSTITGMMSQENDAPACNAL